MPDCIDSASSLDDGCYDGTAAENPQGGPCIYCGPADKPDNVPCALFTGYSGEVAMCDTEGPPLVNQIIGQPWLKLQYKPGHTDAHGNGQPFNNMLTGARMWRPVLRPTLELLVQPCQVNSYCLGFPFAYWLCRWISWNEYGHTGWRLYCHYPVHHDPADVGAPPLPQMVPKDVTVHTSPSGLRPPVFFDFHWGGGVHCFLFENMYCMSTGCDGDDWGCVDEESGGDDKLTALSELFLICDAAINDTDVDDGQAYPHVNRDPIDVKNLCWAECAQYFDERLADDMYDVGATPLSWDDPNKGLFTSQVGFSNREVTTPDPEDEDKEVPLEIILYEPHRALDIPARLTLFELVGSYSIHCETRFYSGMVVKRCLFMAAWLQLFVRPKLTDASYAAMAAAGIEPLEPEDPFDLTLAHPLQSGQEHPLLRFVVLGPGRGLIPGKMEWRGLQANDEFQVGCETDDGSCCGFLREIHRAVIEGLYNNYAEGGPQLMQGGVGFRVRRLMTSNLCRCV